MCNADIADQARWIKRKYSTSHPIIRWLPSKLAAWIGNKYGQELGIPPMRGQKWTAGELNTILLHNMVPSTGGACQLGTFGCIEWESELYSGRPKARCYPFNLPGHRFWGRTRQVCCWVISHMISYMISHMISHMISYMIQQYTLWDIMCDIIYMFSDLGTYMISYMISYHINMMS